MAETARRKVEERMWRDLVTSCEMESKYDTQFDELEKDPKCLFRNALDALKTWCQCVLDADVCQGWSPFHHSEIYKPHKVRNRRDWYYKNCGVRVGEKVYHFNDILQVIMTGDAGTMPKVPHGTPSIGFLFLHVLGLISSVAHCRHSGILLACSKAHEKSQEFCDLIQNVYQTIPREGFFVLTSAKAGIKCVFDFNVVFNGDWAWHYLHNIRTGGPTHKYYIWALCRWVNGWREVVDTRDEEQLCEALTHELIKDTDEKTDECLINENFTGFRLATEDTGEYWASLQENCYKILKVVGKISEHTTPKEERAIRLQLCDALQQPIVFKAVTNINKGIFDICHCWWSWMVRMLRVFVETCWCVFKWSKMRIENFIKLLNVDWVTTQVGNYLKLNKTRAANIKFKPCTDGLINKTVLMNWGFCLRAAAEYAAAERDAYACTLILVMYRHSTLMRRSFAISLKEQYEFVNRGGVLVCDELEEGIRMAKRAVWILYCMWSSLVSIYVSCVNIKFVYVTL